MKSGNSVADMFTFLSYIVYGYSFFRGQSVEQSIERCPFVRHTLPLLCQNG